MLERLVRRLTRSVLIWDVILTLLCLYGASSARIQIEFGKYILLKQVQLPWSLYVTVAVIWVVVFRLITPQRALVVGGLTEAVGRLIAAVSLSSLTFAGLLYLSLRDVSRLQFIYFAFGNLVVLLTFHLVVRSFLYYSRISDSRRRVLIVGSGAMALQLIQEFSRRPWASMEVVGCTSDEPPGDDIRWLGPVSATVDYVRQFQIDELIFALPPQQQDQIVRLSLQLQHLPIMLHMTPSTIDMAFARTPVSALGGVPLISLRESALDDTQRFLKRLFDMVASSLLLLLLAPLMLLIAILIKLESRGPILFKQERVGEHGHRFKMLKFRSMYADADRCWQAVAQRTDDGNLLHKNHADPRVTRIGRKLRRTSLDELPQLFNVLRGEMSLVGPRPEMPYVAAEYAPWQWQRFRVPPGITGWWQINGRSERPMHLNTEDDLYYIQNYSFWLDLRILLKTIPVVLSGRGAF